jgi:hypothetical protein
MHAHLAIGARLRVSCERLLTAAVHMPQTERVTKMRDYHLVSSDSHLEVSPDQWRSCVDAEFAIGCRR